MSKKYWLVALFITLSLSVIVLQLLASRINDARLNFAQQSPGAFNYLLQSNRNLDAFVDALRGYRDLQPDSPQRTELRRTYQQRFDVVWGGFSVFNIKLGFTPGKQQKVTDLLDYSRAFLQRSESLMDPDYVLSKSEIDSLIHDARSITEKIVHIGHEYYVFAGHLSDLWSSKLHTLYQLFWLCVISLLLTGILFVSMLVRSNRRSAELVEKSNMNQKEMKRLIDELRSGKMENKAKDNFIAAASHDLRQPLHALGLYLAATEKHLAGEAGRETLAGAKHCIEELNGLFDSLLDISRLDAGVVNVKKTQFCINRLLALMEQEFSVTAKQVGITLDVCTDNFVVNTDAFLLSRILRNLLENAFTHGGATQVSILCTDDEETVRLSVSDNGVGIPVTEHDEIFMEYYQLNSPHRDRSKGLGLGLSIVKRLCDILGVAITLESDARTGTTFHLHVPAAKGRPALSLPAASPTVTVNDGDLPENALVAVIDDDKNVRLGMVTMLESLNCKAVAAESAAELIRYLNSANRLPDVIVADYRLLNNQTGDMAIHQVRSAFGIDFPAMIITGDTSPARVNEATNSGFELLHKPVRPGELVKCLNRLIQPVRLSENQAVAAAL